MSYPLQNVSTVSDFISQSADFAPKIWEKRVLKSAEPQDIFSEMEGPEGSGLPICVKTDTAKGAGETLYFRNVSGLYGPGVQGETVLTGNEEKQKVNTYSLTVDWIRHAVGHTQRAEGRVAMFSELDNISQIQLGDWLGRKRQSDLLTMFLKKGNASNTIYGNHKASRETLRSADTVSTNMISGAKTRLKTIGGLPAQVGKKGKNAVSKYIFVSPQEFLLPLKNSSTWQNALAYAGERGDSNIIFAGGYVDWDGQLIREFQPMDHDGYGPVGSPLSPRALLGVAITSGTTAQTITGGGTSTAGALTTPRYFENFSNYSYPFSPDDILTETGTRYILGYDPAQGLFAFFSYTVNSGNAITMAGRLGASASGIQATTLGNVAWGSGPYAGLLADNLGSGSILVESNSYGVPIGRSLVLGRMAALRGYGKTKLKRTYEEQDHGMRKVIGVASIYGQTPAKDAALRCPNYLVIEHAATYEGIPYPAVT